jgi:hypothetical protein
MQLQHSEDIPVYYLQLVSACVYEPERRPDGAMDETTVIEEDYEYGGFTNHLVLAQSNMKGVG